MEQLYEKKYPKDQIGVFYDHIELPDGKRRKLTQNEATTLIFPEGAKVFQGSVLYSEGATSKHRQGRAQTHETKPG